MFLVIIVEVKKVEKKEFLTICDSTLKGTGFIKKGGAYYLIHGSELVGAVYLRKSSYGSVYYVECGIAIHGYNEAFPFPKYHDVDISTRFQFPLKVHLKYDPTATHGYSVDLERNTAEEIQEGIIKGVRDWLYPALCGGKQYLLDNWEKYKYHHLSEKVYAALTEWKTSGNMPVKQNSV